MKKQYLLLLLLLLLTPNLSLSWDNNITHPGITNKAVDYLMASDSSWAFLSGYSDFNVNTSTQLTYLDEGSVKEDYALSADWDTSLWGSQQDSNVPLLSWKAHGYNPKTGEAWYNIPDTQNAYQYSSDIWSDIQTKSNFYFQVGRFCHLIEDMASAAHAHADTHATGDDLEKYGKSRYSDISYSLSGARQPASDGLTIQSGLPHGDLTANTYGNFIKNVVWRTYYMTSYYGGNLVEREGDRQPDSELKRMFPYSNGGLRYDDGGWFVNDSYVIDDVGNNWIGWGIGMNPDWWECPGDSGYFYLENIDGDPDSSNPSESGNGIVPAVFRINKFTRINASDNLNMVLASNSKLLAKIYCEELFKLSSEWVSGFIQFAHD
ncbi:MAG: hypothetical protein GY714_28800 [Desulfobacterales bacterium]|nr:hypothetical protein [Desulfobacterales bacterium]MCP4160790.1 hypothetical protein [Deltaproteobacteria bacterium]